MNTETLKTLERDEEGRITIVFTLAYSWTLNQPSATPYGAWALVKNGNEVIIVKESKSTSSHYSKQDIGFILHSPKYRQHYDISTNQYDNKFGKGLWEKIWLENDEFQSWMGDKNIVTDSEANSLQEESWKSTGHR
jgi:hypothetical protein